MKRRRLSRKRTIDAGVPSGARRAVVETAPPAVPTPTIPSEKSRQWWPGAWETVDQQAGDREHRVLAELAELRASIERLRREREEAIGQFRALTRPIAEPIETGPDAGLKPCATGSTDAVSLWELENPGDPLSGFGREESSATAVGVESIDTLDERPPVDEFEELARRVREANLHRAMPKPLPRRRSAAARLRLAAASLAAVAVSGSAATARAPLPIGRHEAVRRLVPSPWDGRVLAAWSTVISLGPAHVAPRAEMPVPSRPLPLDVTSVKPAWVQAGVIGTTTTASAAYLEELRSLADAPDGETQDQNP